MNQWKTIQPVPLNSIAKAGVTVCDTMGNQAMEFLTYLPDDAFIDNIGGTDLNDEDQQAIRLSLLWDATEDTEARKR